MLLKSDHFGIEITHHSPYANLSYSLKSDHFGIEMNIIDTVKKGKVMLKSDHFGIEIVDQRVIVVISLWVKIRPFWD